MSHIAPQPQPTRAVLVVEDDPQICELLTLYLEAGGYETVCVQNDQAAYEALRTSRPFACMVLDVNLGFGTTGYDVARFARKIDKALPVIFVSGESSPDSFRANGVPGALFIPKPFTQEELMERLQTLVGDNDA